jgi:hypothetical protein
MLVTTDGGVVSVRWGDFYVVLSDSMPAEVFRE